MTARFLLLKSTNGDTIVNVEKIKMIVPCKVLYEFENPLDYYKIYLNGKDWVSYSPEQHDDVMRQLGFQESK